MDRINTAFSVELWAVVERCSMSGEKRHQLDRTTLLWPSNHGDARQCPLCTWREASANLAEQLRFWPQNDRGGVRHPMYMERSVCRFGRKTLHLAKKP